MVKTLDISPAEDGSYGWNLGFPMDWTVACDLLGIPARRATRNEYRKWLDLSAGEWIDEVQFGRLDLMFQFANHRGGSQFSRAGYLALESEIRERVAKDHPKAHEEDIPVMVLAAVQAHLRDKYGLNPYKPVQT